MDRGLPRYRSGNAQLDVSIAELVQAAGAGEHDHALFEMIVSAIRLVREDNDRADLTLINAALKELRHSMGVFAPYRDTRKLSIFGSARTPRDHPTYETAVQLGHAIAERGWMVITGAGPGIMAAGVEGAGAENSFGVGIRLPFEEQAAATIANDPKLVNFNYFFTRKLTFMKESHGFALLPGGFGTLDESFELLTLLQTGKTPLAPVVLLDAPGDDYWQGWYEFVTQQLERDGLISPDDMAFIKMTDSVDQAVEEFCSFYHSYHSMRIVGPRLVIRLHHEPATALLSELQSEFGDIITTGSIERIQATPVEVTERDCVDLNRVAFQFDRRHFARLRQMIDRLNQAAPSASA